MNTLLVGYDLNKAGQNYDDLIGTIEDQGLWWHHLDSTWLVRTTKSAVEMKDLLKQHIDGNDELLVINVTGDAAAWTGFTAKGGAWLKDNL